MFVALCFFFVVLVFTVATAALLKSLNLNAVRLGIGGLVFLVLVTGILSSWRQIDTRNVAVVTTFGRPVGQLDNGPHLIAPWEDTTEMPATIQTDTYVNSNKNCVNVRIAYQIIACADISQQWRIKEEAVDGLYQNYKHFDSVRDTLVSRKLFTAANDAFKDYDPFKIDENGNSITTPLPELSKKINQDLKQAIGSQIEVLSTFVSLVHVDQATQAKLNALQAQVAQTRIQNQAKQTATAEAQANQILANSVNNNPGVLESKCLDIMKSMVDKGQALPAGFSCLGQGSSVVVPATGR